MRLQYLLYEALTETTLAQLIVSLYPQPNSMLYSRGIDRNNNLLHGAQWQSVPTGGIMYGVSIP